MSLFLTIPLMASTSPPSSHTPPQEGHLSIRTRPNKSSLLISPPSLTQRRLSSSFGLSLAAQSKQMLAPPGATVSSSNLKRLLHRMHFSPSSINIPPSRSQLFQQIRTDRVAREQPLAAAL